MLLYILSKQERNDNMMYRSAIVNELGDVMFWRDELHGDEQIGCILNEHPEWSVKCIESEVLL